MMKCCMLSVLRASVLCADAQWHPCMASLARNPCQFRSQEPLHLSPVHLVRMCSTQRRSSLSTLVWKRAGWRTVTGGPAEFRLLSVHRLSNVSARLHAAASLQPPLATRAAVLLRLPPPNLMTALQCPIDQNL